jgi:DNA-binding response OmpR family regulator
MRKVLIVDDEPDICKFLKAMLERKRCQVFTALKAEEAWELFQQEHPQAVAIDIHLSYSDYNGVELLKRIRTMEKTTLCLMFTRDDDDKTLTEAKTWGVDGIYIKPPSEEALKEMVDRLATDQRKEASNG